MGNKWWLRGLCSVGLSVCAFSVFMPNTGPAMIWKIVAFTILMLISIAEACEAGHSFKAEKE